MGRIVLGDNMRILPGLPEASVDLIYIDPPFNTGRTQKRKRIQVEQADDGDRQGFGGKRYHSKILESGAFDDAFDDFLAFVEPRIRQAHRILKASGSFFLHLDYREVHGAKLLCDAVFGRDCFQNELIWAYDFGGRSKSRWSAKHDNILWYSREPKGYTFDFDAMDRIPYMAPGLVGAEKAARGKTPTDVWWHTIVPTNSHEKTGYPTQKPLGILERIVKVHSKPGDFVCDFFAGSGTTGAAAAKHGRDFLLIDSNPEAVAVMEKRLAFAEPEIEKFI